MQHKIAVILVTVLAIVSFSLLYAFTPISVTENPPIIQKSVTVSGFPSGPISIPTFSNITIPSNALSVTVDISLNATNFGNGTAINPSRLIVGLFQVNGTTWGIEKAGYYQPSLGYYEIIVNPMSYSIKSPVTNPNGSINLTRFTYDNYTFRGKTLSVGIDPTLNYQLEVCSVHWVEMKYTYQRF